MSNLAIIISDMYCVINNKIIIDNTYQTCGIEIIDISILKSNNLDFNYQKSKLKFCQIQTGKLCLKLNKKFDIGKFYFRHNNQEQISKNIILNLIFYDNKYFLIKDSYLLTKIDSIKFITVTNSL
jgi:hypothetical protein